MENTIYIAGGCFWGTEHFYKQIKGVVATQAGYANGNTQNPTYEQVYTDTTLHAETVKIVYEDTIVSLDFLVDMLFTIVDPASVNRQGGDVGTRYRTGVYYTTPEQLPVIEQVFARHRLYLEEPIAIQTEPLKVFYPAEEYHQKYLLKNPQGYCHIPLRSFAYLRLYNDLKLLIEGVSNPVSAMANAAALLKERMNYFWVGFYTVSNGQLELGPFQGSPACYTIGYGKGVCGAAWERKSSVIVPDVERFLGHIACSSLSKSEIVVPVLSAENEVIAVLDIDSDELSAFDDKDRTFLERITQTLHPESSSQ